MLVYHVAVRVRPEKREEARELFRRLVTASRGVPGVLGFDILQDPWESDSFISVEVYEDAAAVRRQEVLPQLDDVMSALPDLVTAGPAGAKFSVSTCEPWPASSL